MAKANRRRPSAPRTLLRCAEIVYNTTVEAAIRHPAADARRVLTEEHCALACKIDRYRRHEITDEALDEAVREAMRVVDEWTGVSA